MSDRLKHFRKILITSTTLTSFAAIPASADMLGFSLSLEVEDSAFSDQSFSLETSKLTHYDDPFAIFPEELDLSITVDRTIAAALNWQSQTTRIGNLDLSYGSSLSAAYSNSAYAHADFTDDYMGAANRLTSLTLQSLPADTLSNKSIAELNNFFRGILSVAQNPNQIYDISKSDIESILPDNLSAETKNAAIEEIMQGLTDIKNSGYRGFRTDFSGTAEYVSFEFDNFIKGQWDRHGVAPYFQVNAGYQLSGFMTHNEDGIYYHGPTASITAGLTDNFNNGSWALFATQPFSFKHQGADGLSTQTSDDVRIGFNVTSLNAHKPPQSFTAMVTPHGNKSPDWGFQYTIGLR